MLKEKVKLLNNIVASLGELFLLNLEVRRFEPLWWHVLMTLIYVTYVCECLGTILLAYGEQKHRDETCISKGTQSLENVCPLFYLVRPSGKRHTYP